MKQLLRKMFFWDESPQGAHFGLTLFFLVPWIWLTLMYLLIYPMFFITQYKDAALSLLALISLLALLILTYGVALLLRVLIVNQHGLLKRLPWGMLIQGVVLLAAGIYLYKWLVFKSTSVLLAYSGSAMDGLQLLTVSSDNRLLNALVSGNNIIIAIVLVVVLLAAGYISLGKTIAGIGQVPYSQLWTKGVKAQWVLFIGIYLLSWSMGLYAVYSSRKAVAELEKTLGRPVTPEALGEIYFHGQQPDADFWKKIEETEPGDILNQDDTDQTMDDDDSETEPSDDAEAKKEISWNTVYSTMANHPFDESISQEIIDRWKTDFLDRPETKAWEALFEQPLPPAAREFSDAKPVVNITITDLKFGRMLCRYERSRIRIALDSKDFHEVEAALSRMRNASDYYEHDIFMIGGLVWVACEAFQLDALAHIIDSAQPSDEWLRQLDKWLESREKVVGMVQWNGNYGEAVCGVNLFQMTWKGKAISNGGVMFKPTNYSLLNWLVPQTLFFIAMENKGSADLHRTGIEHGYEQSRAQGLFAGMLQPSMEIGNKKYKSITAEYRIVRGLIAAELYRRQHGSFPQELTLLEDPFNDGQPLKYQCGEVEYHANVHVYRNPSYEDEPPQQTIHGIRIWTVGKNGQDDGGLCNTFEHEDDRTYWLHDKR